MNKIYDTAVLGTDINELLDNIGAKFTGSRWMAKKYEEEQFVKKIGGTNIRGPYADKLVEALTEGRDSDWDFAVQDTPETRARLSQAGFVIYGFEENPYGDDLSTAVACKELHYTDWSKKSLNIGNHSIQVILKRDIRVFDRVWDDMNVEFYARLIWKGSELYQRLTESDKKQTIGMLMNTLYWQDTNKLSGKIASIEINTDFAV